MGRENSARSRSCAWFADGKQSATNLKVGHLLQLRQSFLERIPRDFRNWGRLVTDAPALPTLRVRQARQAARRLPDMMNAGARKVGTTVTVGERTMAGPDVRMRGFQTRVEVAQLIDWIEQRVGALDTEWISLTPAGEGGPAQDVAPPLGG